MSLTTPIPPATPIPQRPQGDARASWCLSLSAFAFLLCFTLPCSATSITLQGGFGYPTAQDSSGLPLPAGHKVSVGTFADGFVPEDHAGDLPALLLHWREFAFTTTATIDGDPGSFWLKHSSSDGTNAEGFSFPGKKIHILLTRTDAAYAEPATDASNVVDYALFSSTAAAWTFRSPPSEINLPPNDLSSLNTSQITSAVAGTVDAASGLFQLVSYASSPSLSAFDQWLAATFGENSGHNADSVVGPAGLTALATYALASTPQATGLPYTTITDEAGRIGIEYTRTIDPALSTHAQACTTLSSWTLPVTESIVSSTATTETVQAFPNFPEGTDQSKAFFRIRVEPAIQN